MSCKAGALLANPAVPTEDRDLLATWMDTGRDHRGRPTSAQTMVLALAAEGHHLGSTTVKDHRARRCVCYREAVTA